MPRRIARKTGLFIRGNDDTLSLGEKLIIPVLTARMRTSWVGSVLHPAGQFLAMAIAIRSWINTTGAGMTWKGLVYRPSFPPPA